MRGTRPAGKRFHRISGSSPRVRGTRDSRRRSADRSVHPRACGERVHRLLRLIADTRFIPARAGNAPCRGRSPSASRAVHPRACGERSRVGWATSSASVHPRACGERSSLESCRAIACSVHPRACGERLAANWLWRSMPVHPRACGERSSRRFRPRHGRFIPARAGNASLQVLSSSSDAGSSPRVRGTLADSDAASSSDGSSPRVRGTPDRLPLRSIRDRFIPARAGNAGRSIPRRSHRGSSPRVRGTPPVGGRAA